MRIGLIGCGRVGTTLFYYLNKTNVITGVFDSKTSNQRRTARILRIKKNKRLEEICTQSRVLIFATPDDAILAAYQKIRPFITGKKYLFHCSGLLPARIFPKTKNIFRAAIHPFATFPIIMIPPQRKHYILYAEGDRKAIAIARRVFNKRYFTVRRLSTRHKRDYHLIGIFSSNLLVGLHAAIKKLTRKINWSEKELHDTVYPIIEETINNITSFGIERALSGPLERGDQKTVKKHLQTLKQHKELLLIYKTLSRVLIDAMPPSKKKKELLTLLNT